jgi:carbonic anhydrase
MDARLDPAKYAGLSEGDAHVIRNAGGRATDDAIRSLVISYKLLGTREWFVIHHKDVGRGPGSIAGRFNKWHTIRNLEQSVIEDVAHIRSHDLVPKDIPIYGYIYDVRSGRLSEVAQATRVGRAVKAPRHAAPSHAVSEEFGLNDG